MGPFTALSIFGGPLLGGLFGGAQQDAANRAAQRAVDLQHEANLANWKYGKKSGKARYKYDKESVAIQRRNIEDNLAYQEATANQSWRYQMQIQAFDYANQMRAFNKSQQTASQQLSFNNLAYDFALQDAARWEQEQNVMLDFEEKSTMMEFRYNQRGEALNKQQAEVVMQQTRGMGQLQQQRAYVEGLKQMGQAQAKGATGISAEKAAQAAIAETGAATAAIIQEVMNGEQNYALTNEAINMKLEQLNDQFYLDKAQLAASRVSLKNQGKVTRYQAQLNKAQADMNAIANMMLEPMVPPAIPKPLALPRPELQDPMKFDKDLWKTIKPKKGQAAYTNPVVAGFGQFASGALSAAAQAYVPGKGFM